MLSNPRERSQRRQCVVADQATAGPIADRGQSEVLGVALLIGVIVVSTTLLAMFGTAAITEQQRDLSVPQAIRALEALDSRASGVALGDTTTHQLDLGLAGSEGSLDTDHDAGWMRIETIHPTSPDKVVANETLGAIVYRDGETAVGYQAGGIWRADNEESVMLSPPEFHYTGKTLAVPIITIQGSDAVYSQVEITRAGEPARRFPDASRDLENKLEDIDAPVIRVTVQSEYYEAWARFFAAETTGGVVAVSHADETASLTMPTLAGVLNLETGVISTSGAGEFFVAGNSKFIDSYNSANGSYAATNAENATLRSAGDVTMEGTADVRGDVKSGGNVTLSGSATVTGDVEWTESYSASGGSSVGGTVDEIRGVDPIPTITWLVDHRVNQTQDVNDNNATSVITNDHLDLNPGETGELDAGTYYVEELDVDKSTLVLDTTNGPVTLGVENWVRLTDGQGRDSSEIRVKGNGIARIFVASRDTVQVSPTGLGNRDVHLHAGKGARIHVPQENSTQLRIFGPTPFKATIAGSQGQATSVDAIIYAPAGRTGSGYIWVKHADLYGSVSVGQVTAGQGGGIHFNEATAGARLNVLPDISDVDFLHVTRRRINVTAASS